MADARLTLRMQGVDNTGKAFGGVAGRIGNLKKLAVGLGSVLALHQVGRAISRRITELDELGNRASRLGVEASSIQRLDSAFDRLGIQAGTTDAIFRDMQRRLTMPAGARELRNIGLELDAIKGLKPEQQFMEIAAAIADVSDPIARSRAQMELLGRQSMNLNTLFREGGDVFKDSMQKIMDGVQTAGNDTVDMADKVDDGMRVLKESFKATFDRALGSAMEWAEKHFGRLDVAIPMMFERIKWFRAAAVAMLKNFGENAWHVWEGISRDWGETLRWMGRGAWEFVQSVGMMMAELGSQFWSLITTGEWDQQAITRQFRRLTDSLKPDLKALGIELVGAVIPDWEEFSREARSTLTEAAEATDRLTRESRGRVIDEIRDTARAAVDEVTHAASSVSASTYEAFTAALRQPGGLEMAVSQRGAGVVGRGTDAPAERVAQDLRTIIGELREQTRIWQRLGVTA